MSVTPLVSRPLLCKAKPTERTCIVFCCSHINLLFLYPSHVPNVSSFYKDGSSSMLRPSHPGGPTRVPQFLTELRSARDTRAARRLRPSGSPAGAPSRGLVPLQPLRLGREGPRDRDRLRRRHEAGGVVRKVLPGPIGSVGGV